MNTPALSVNPEVVPFRHLPGKIVFADWRKAEILDALQLRHLKCRYTFLYKADNGQVFGVIGKALGNEGHELGTI